MKLATDIWSVVRNYGEEKALEMVKKAGYDGVDYSFFWTNPADNILDDNYLERAENTKKLLEKYDLVCNQVHAPFGSTKYKSPMDCSHREYNGIVRSLEYASILGAQHAVIHSVAVPMGIDTVAHNVKYYKSFEHYAKQFGIKIAVENLFPAGMLSTPKLLNAALEQLDPEWFVALLDVGHSNINHVAPESYIRNILPGRLQGLHLHDNNGQVDQHLAPYMGNIQWDYVLEALVETNYPGDFTMETCAGFVSRYDPKYYAEALAFCAALGRNMMAQIEAMKG